jgi:hypothetical protein
MSNELKCHLSYLIVSILLSVYLCLSKGNTLPVPMNICPSPKSLISFFRRVKKILCETRSSSKADERTNEHRHEGFDSLNIRRSPNNNHFSLAHSSSHDRFRNEGIFDRNQSFVFNETLTYKIVIERIVKRFLLYYKNKHTGLKENNDGLEIKEFKNDISSLRFELLNEMDMLDDVRTSLLDTMSKLNDSVHMNFDVERIKTYLNTS